MQVSVTLLDIVPNKLTAEEERQRPSPIRGS
jgi:hypothetical protein